MRIGVVGINHKLASLNLRERFALVCQRRFHPKLVPLHHPAVVLLSTCNRTELYFCGDDLAKTHSQILQLLRDELEEEFDQKLYSFFGHDCFSHLSRVTSGLDSAMLAETEIQGQVKIAYENTTQHQTLPLELHYLFQKALKIGKSIRSKIFGHLSLPSLEQAVFHVAGHFFENLTQARILFIGASTINQKLIAYLKNRGLSSLTLCNRSEEKAQLVAEKWTIPSLAWDQFDRWSDYDCVIFGATTTTHLLPAEKAKNASQGKKLLIDLGVPRNVEARVGRLPAITLVNIDHLSRFVRFREQRLADAVISAEEKVIHQAKQHVELFQTKTACSTAPKNRQNRVL